MPTPPQVDWTFHGSALVRDYHATVATLGRLIGLRAIEYSDSDAPLVARRGGMTWIADNSIELVEPTVAQGGPARMLARNGPGLFCLALYVRDIRATADWFTYHGVGVVGDMEQGFLFTHPRDTAGIYLEWAGFHQPPVWEPRFGAPVPPMPGKPLIEVQRIDHWGAVAADPRATFARLQQIWPAPVLWCDFDAPPERPFAAFWIGDGVFALYRDPGSVAEMQRLWGIAATGSRQHLMSLYVNDLAQAEATLRAEGIRILRGSAAERLLVTHPDDLHGLTIAWTDRAVGALAP